MVLRHNPGIHHSVSRWVCRQSHSVDKRSFVDCACKSVVIAAACSLPEEQRARWTAVVQLCPIRQLLRGTNHDVVNEQHHLLHAV